MQSFKVDDTSVKSAIEKYAGETVQTYTYNKQAFDLGAVEIDIKTDTRHFRISQACTASSYLIAWEYIDGKLKRIPKSKHVI